MVEIRIQNLALVIRAGRNAGQCFQFELDHTLKGGNQRHCRILSTIYPRIEPEWECFEAKTWVYWSYWYKMRNKMEHTTTLGDH